MTEAGSGRYRRGALVLWIALAVLAVSCVGQYVRYRLGGKEELVVFGRINPNEADWSSLVRLPGIGEVRAKAIVAYRKEYERAHGNGEAAFRVCADMGKIKGIGEVTIAEMCEYLTFESP